MNENVALPILELTLLKIFFVTKFVLNDGIDKCLFTTRCICGNVARHTAVCVLCSFLVFAVKFCSCMEHYTSCCTSSNKVSQYMIKSELVTVVGWQYSKTYFLQVSKRTCVHFFFCT